MYSLIYSFLLFELLITDLLEIILSTFAEFATVAGCSETVWLMEVVDI